jgi:LPPG:FO 2-phospho-L-lactate transferase
VDGMVIDGVDEGEGERIEALGMRVLATAAVMRDAPDRARLAQEVLDFGAGLVTL